MSATSDIALLRFLRARVDETSVLNPPVATRSAHDATPAADGTSDGALALSQALLRAARALPSAGPRFSGGDNPPAALARPAAGNQSAAGIASIAPEDTYHAVQPARSERPHRGAGRNDAGNARPGETRRQLPPENAVNRAVIESATLLSASADRCDEPEPSPRTTIPALSLVRALARRLHSVDPAALRGGDARTAFWVNLFNALVLDTIAGFGVRRSVRESPGFFRRAAYRVGSERYSLEVIEHGLLRGNRPPLPGLPPPFRPGDPRVAFGPDRPDPRVHFALNCGARSCPPIAAYDAARLPEQLETAAAAFINAEGVREEDGGLTLSPLFQFYAEDFGGEAGARAWLGHYLVDPALRARVAREPLRMGDYDWSLDPRLAERR